MYHRGYPQPQCPNELLQLMNEAVFGAAAPKKLQPCEHVCRPSRRGLGLLPSDSIAGKVGAGLGKQLPPQGMLVSLPCLGSRHLTLSFQTAYSGQTFAIQVHVKPQLFANGRFCAEAEPCWWLSAQQRPFLFLFLEQRGWKRGK